jgi:SAM-dependent methyltransferase
MLRAFIERGDAVTGVDRDLLEVEVDGLVRERGVLIKSTAETAELPQGSFDLAYGIHVIEHLVDPASVFEKTFRALKPGGIVFFLTPNADSRGLTLFRENWWNLEDPTHVRFFSPESATGMLARAGFEKVEVRRSRWDSLSVEGNSLARVVYRRPLENGVLSTRTGRLLAVASMPFTLIARLAVPSIAPTMEVVAHKPRAASAFGGE